jgi:glycosyltransferase involved in cell wall biosynthesis
MARTDKLRKLMRFVVDATAAERQRAGVGRFARGLLAGLAEVDTVNDYYLVTTGRKRLGLVPSSLPTHHHWIRLPVPERIARIAWHRLRIAPPPTWLVRNASLFFTPDFALPPSGHVPSILTVHDLSFLTHPECADEGLRRYLATEVPRSIDAASAVVAVSQTTADALHVLLGVEPARVAIVPNGVDPQFCPMPAARDDAEPSLPFGLAPGYLLTVGTLEPRKNHLRLLQAFAKLTRRVYRQPGSGPILVIAGRLGWKFEPIFREIARLNLGASVRFLTNIDDDDLLSLYRHARAFVFPSLYEGFGIPPLEAMACGIPVAASTAGALSEVLGSAALFFNPLDVDEMSTVMEQILIDDQARQNLRELGLVRARTYTWTKSAASALHLFERVAA